MGLVGLEVLVVAVTVASHLLAALLVLQTLAVAGEAVVQVLAVLAVDQE